LKNAFIRWLHNDDTARLLESNAQLILDGDGQLIDFKGIDLDITESRRPEKVL